LMDAKTSNGTDDDFVVFADEVPNQDFQQVANMTDSNTRTLAINFEQGTATIEIVGTQIAPEFGAGTIAAIILAIAIVATIVASTRYNKRINFLPK